MTRDTLSHWLTHPAVGVVAAGPDARVSAVVVVTRSAVAAVAVQVALSVVTVVSVEKCSSRRGAYNSGIPVVAIVGPVVVVVAVVRLRSGSGTGQRGGHQATQESQ